MSSGIFLRFAATSALVCFLACSARDSFAQSDASSKARPAATVSKVHAADQAAIEGVLQSLTKAIAARDAKLLAANWTAEGEFENAAGLVLSGREALESGFAELFARTPEASAEIRSATLRFVSPDTAIGEGHVTVRRGPAQPSMEASYDALFVRDGDTWRLAQFTESSVEEASIQDLAWLIGEWNTASDQGVEIRTTYSWDKNEKFIQLRFARKEADLALSGTQMIGIDPATGLIRSWIFESDGGIGEAHWTRDGDHWILDANGTLVDGSTLQETNVLRRINGDTFTFQSIDRLLDGEPLPDLPPTKLTRVKP